MLKTCSFAVLHLVAGLVGSDKEKRLSQNAKQIPSLERRAGRIKEGDKGAGGWRAFGQPRRRGWKEYAKA